jgi:5-methylcytosine-specific restriction protein A
MPKRPLKACCRYGCRSYAIDGSSYCDEHHPIRDDPFRKSAQERGYDSRWTKFRAMYLRQHPICERCGKAANVVHHRKPIDEGGEQYDELNLESMCRICHERHHGRVR